MEIADLTSAVASDGDVGSSVVTLINKIVEGIDEAGSKKATQELGDTLNENANEIADAVIANTTATNAFAGDPLNPTNERRNADGQPYILPDGTTVNKENEEKEAAKRRESEPTNTAPADQTGSEGDDNDEVENVTVVDELPPSNSEE